MGRFRVPASKPETQRALVIAALADGTSTIRSPLRSSETLRMIEACRAIGAEITHDEDEIQVVGTGIGEQMSLVPTPPNIHYFGPAAPPLLGASLQLSAH